MKLQLNFDAKTVTIENDVKMGDFFSFFSEKFEDWKEWSIKTNTIVKWKEPIIIERQAPFIWPRPYYPHDPVYVCSGATTTATPGPMLTIQAERSAIVNLEVTP